jgi:hypothetical protein
MNHGVLHWGDLQHATLVSKIRSHVLINVYLESRKPVEVGYDASSYW